MSSYSLPLEIKKTVSFPRMSKKNVKQYEIWGIFKDSSYDSGVRNILLETVLNPEFLSFEEYEKVYEYSITTAPEPADCGSCVWHWCLSTSDSSTGGATPLPAPRLRAFRHRGGGTLP